MKLFIRKPIIISIVVVILSTAWVLYTSMKNQDQTANMFSAPQKGFIAPDFSLSNLEEETVQLSNFKGKFVIVNVWASWCKPCQYEMPAFQNVYEKYSEKGLVLLAVNNTYQDNYSDVVNFVKENNLTFPILLDKTGEVSKLYQVQALPSTYFIDQKGIIKDIIIGGPMSEALIESKVLELEENVSNP